MKYAVAMVLDQTYGYLTADGSVTISHPEAMLHDLREAAEALTADVDGWVEEVVDEGEFRAREDTW